MNAEPAERFAAMLAALSQPTRLRIIEVVGARGVDGTPAGQIAKAVHCPASTLPFHLKELSLAGLAHSRQDGRFVSYSANFDTMAGLVSFLTENCCGGKKRLMREARRA